MVPRNDIQLDPLFTWDLDRVHRYDNVLPLSSTRRHTVSSRRVTRSHQTDYTAAQDSYYQTELQNQVSPTSPPYTEMMREEPAQNKQRNQRKKKGSFGWLAGKFKKYQYSNEAM